MSSLCDVFILNEINFKLVSNGENRFKDWRQVFRTWYLEEGLYGTMKSHRMGGYIFCPHVTLTGNYKMRGHSGKPNMI